MVDALQRGVCSAQLWKRRFQAWKYVISDVSERGSSETAEALLNLVMVENAMSVLTWRAILRMQCSGACGVHIWKRRLQAWNSIVEYVLFHSRQMTIEYQERQEALLNSDQKCSNDVENLLAD